MIVVWILVGVVVLLGIALAVSYNRFVRQRNLVHESWRQIDVELQRRYDLIPNLVESVKGYAAHEAQVLQAVTEARAHAQQVRAAGGATPAAQGLAEDQLSGALGRLIATSEAYPQLRANENFLHLQQALTETEDRIAAGRRFYNGNVRALNTRVGAFPSNVVAGMFSFKPEEYFETNDPAVRATPRVSFGPPAAPPQVAYDRTTQLPPQPQQPPYPPQP